MFVPSVERIHLPRSRSQRAITEEPTGDNVKSQAVNIALGGLGSTSLYLKHRKWSWIWVVGGKNRSFPSPGVHVAAAIVAEPVQRIQGTGDASSVADMPTSLVGAVHNRKARRGRTSVIWTAGATREVLCMAPIVPASSSRILGQSQPHLDQSVRSREVFDSPISQIASSDFISEERASYATTALLVRTQTRTHYLHIVPNPLALSSSLKQPSATFHRVGSISAEQTEQRRHVDAALDHSSWGRAAVADEVGGAWVWWEARDHDGHGPKTVLKLTKIGVIPGSSERDDTLYQIAFGSRPDTLLLLSRKSLSTVDLNSTSLQPNILLTLPDGEVFTSLDKDGASRSSGMVCVVTNLYVLWIDESGNGDVVLKWKHEMGGGLSKDLAIRTTSIQPRERQEQSYLVTLLDPGVRSVVAVQCPAYGRPVLQSQPWSSAELTLVYRSVDAFTIMPTVLASGNNLRTKECIHLVTVQGSDTDSEIPHPDEDMDAFDDSIRRHEVLQGRWAWISINESYGTAILHMDDFIQDLKEDEAPMNHFTTLADLARDSAYRSGPSKRSNLLRALRFPTTTTAADMRRSVDAAGFPFVQTAGHSQYTTGTWLEPPHESKSREASAASNLAHDLVLSSTIVFSETLDNAPVAVQPVGPPRSPEDLFAAATSNLSLDDSTPVAKLSFLTPRLTEFSDEVMPVASPSFAQPILNEWTIGDDPASYHWTPPSSIGTPLAVPRPVRPLPTSRPASPKRPLFQQSWAARSSPARIANSSPPRARASSPLQREITSQIAEPTFLQTQIEPGPFGARPEHRKKKSVRRKGGF